MYLLPLKVSHDGLSEPVLHALRAICDFRAAEFRKLNPAHRRSLAAAEALISLYTDLEQQIFGDEERHVEPPPNARSFNAGTG